VDADLAQEGQLTLRWSPSLRSGCTDAAATRFHDRGHSETATSSWGLDRRSNQLSKEVWSGSSSR